jgi:hypothetical protein
MRELDGGQIDGFTISPHHSIVRMDGCKTSDENISIE